MKDVLKEYVGPKKKPENSNYRWWTEPKEELYKHLFECVSTLEQRQNYRTLANIKHSRAYSNLEVLGNYSSLYGPTQKDTTTNKITLNIIRSCVDTVTSKIAKAKPRPLYLTEGGNFDLKRKAQSLTQFLDGTFDAMEIYPKKQRTFKDACIIGTGLLKFYSDVGKKAVVCERTLAEEILVDDLDAVYGSPKTIYQRRLVSKDVLKEMFDKSAHDDIDQATNGIAASFNSDQISDLVKVIEAWHLPSIDGAGDGLHVMAIDTVTLSMDKWEHNFFPFSFDRWSERQTGFFGSGLAEELMGIQLEINRILKNIQTSMHRFAVPRVYLENASMVSTQQITNEIGIAVKYSGHPPVFDTPAAMSPDIYAHLWQLVGKAYEISGVSQLSATSKKPEGLNSGVALREYQDVESDRFQIVAQRYEETFLDAARIVIDLTKELSAKTGDVKVKVSDQGSMKTIRWSEINLEEEQYLMRVFPTSILPTQPAGKLQTVTELTQSGFLDRETAVDLLDFPDLKSAMNMALAPKKLVYKMLDKMVESGTYEPPEPYMDLALTQTVAQHYYLQAKIENVEEDKLQLIRDFLSDISTELSLRDEAQAQAMQMMAPQARPEPRPTSPLLPQVPGAAGAQPNLTLAETPTETILGGG